jgi:hypothetical protein
MFHSKLMLTNKNALRFLQMQEHHDNDKGNKDIQIKICSPPQHRRSETVFPPQKHILHLIISVITMSKIQKSKTTQPPSLASAPEAFSPGIKREA